MRLSIEIRFFLVYNFDMGSFGNKLKELRNDKELTQKAMAEQLNISIPTLSHWECDYQEPAFKDLIMLSAFFDVTVVVLLGLSESGTTSIAAPMGDKLTASERELLSDFRKLSPYLQGIAINTVRGLTGAGAGDLHKKA